MRPAEDDLLEMWMHLPWREAQRPAAAEAGRLQAEQAELLAAVTVALGVQLGTIELSLEDLVDLVPGSRLAVRTEEEIEVELTLGGAPFACCRLVAEGGELFLEVKTLVTENNR